MESNSSFNPRQRFREVPAAPAPQVAFEAAQLAPAPSSEDFSFFIEKTMEYKRQRISHAEYQDVLHRWFPILKNFQSVYMDINIIFQQTASSLSTETDSIVSHVSHHPPEPLPAPPIPSARPPSPPPTAGRLPPSLEPVEPLHDPEEDACLAPDPSKNRVMIGHIRKLKAFWNANSAQAPHTFKKKFCHQFSSDSERMFIEKLDMGKKVIRNGGLREEPFKSFAGAHREV